MAPLTEAVIQTCSEKKLFLKNSQIHRKTLVPESLFKIKLQALGLRPATLLKKTLTQVFFCEFCEIFKNNFFTEHLRWLLFHLVLSKNLKDLYYFEITR